MKENILNTNNIRLVAILKGFAIFMIIVCHFMQGFKPYISNSTFIFSQFLQTGCQLFFILSSFTLCLSFDRRKPTYFEFMKKRISKLIIPYWLAILMFYIINLIIKNNNIITPYTIDSRYFSLVYNLLLIHGFRYSLENNNVVFGGWFVGAIVIFYLIFPLMYKIYNKSNKFWEKYRIVLFPLIILSLSSFVIFIGGKLINTQTILGEHVHTYINYYSNFINHLPCFALGFSLYDLFKSNKFKQVKLPFLIFLITIVSSYICFRYEFLNNLILMPFIATISYLFLYVFLQNKDNFITNNKFIKPAIKLFEKFGKYNYEIFLTHSIIVFFANYFIIGKLNLLIKPILLMFLMLPITIFICYWIALVFNNICKGIEKLIHIIFKKLKD